MGRRQRTVEQPPQPPSGQAGQVFLLYPDEFAEESAARALPGSRRVGNRAARLAAYGAAGLLAGAGLLRLGSTLARPASPVPAAELDAVPQLSPQGRVDRVADTLAFATGAFELRVRLFQTHQMLCPDLARGLIVVEERWAEYNAARAASGVAADSAHTALDQSLYAGVDATERQFEESRCPRP